MYKSFYFHYASEIPATACKFFSPVTDEVDDYDSEIPEIDIPIKERDDGSYRIDIPLPR